MTQTLPIEQGILLCCIRTWVAGLHHDIDAIARIDAMLTHIDAPHAAPYLDGFMFAISQGATRRIAIQCPCTRTLAPDERLLLDTFGLAQQARSFEALLLLRGLVAPQAARAALQSAEAIGDHLAGAGHHLAAPDGAVTRFGLSACSPTLH